MHRQDEDVHFLTVVPQGTLNIAQNVLYSGNVSFDY